MSQITTEITSSKIASDNPIHQRLLFAYEAAKDFVAGNMLEIGCGEGRGLETLAPYCTTYTALDKNSTLLEQLKGQYPNYTFIETNVPPFSNIESNSFDTVIAFQVIEHIRSDDFFIKEIHRVLKPGGKAIITTPNIDFTLTRNPWHEREYTASQLSTLLNKYFKSVSEQGVTGNQKVFDYYELNKKSVSKFARWDIFNLQYKLPNGLLRVPYDMLNRWNRNRMMNADNHLVSNIDISDYSLATNTNICFDLFYVSVK